MSSGNFANFLFSKIIFFGIVLLSITVHEFAHAFSAYLLGDNTAKNEGRMTLYPLAHLDLFGLLAFFIIGFGWAKPVPVDYRNFKNFRRDVAIVSFAGPFSNIMFAFISLLIIKILSTLNLIDSNNIITEILIAFAHLNIILFAFNIIPIPPLDGSKILTSLLPDTFDNFKFWLENNGFMILMFIILFSSITKINIFNFIIQPIFSVIWTFLTKIF